MNTFSKTDPTRTNFQPRSLIHHSSPRSAHRTSLSDSPAHAQAARCRASASTRPPHPRARRPATPANAAPDHHGAPSPPRAVPSRRYARRAPARAVRPYRWQATHRVRRHRPARPMRRPDARAPCLGGRTLAVRPAPRIRAVRGDDGTKSFGCHRMSSLGESPASCARKFRRARKQAFQRVDGNAHQVGRLHVRHFLIVLEHERFALPRRQRRERLPHACVARARLRAWPAPVADRARRATRRPVPRGGRASGRDSARLDAATCRTVPRLRASPAPVSRSARTSPVRRPRLPCGRRACASRVRAVAAACARRACARPTRRARRPVRWGRVRIAVAQRGALQRIARLPAARSLTRPPAAEAHRRALLACAAPLPGPVAVRDRRAHRAASARSVSSASVSGCMAIGSIGCRPPVCARRPACSIYDDRRGPVIDRTRRHHDLAASDNCGREYHHGSKRHGCASLTLRESAAAPASRAERRHAHQAQ